jgi:uroporphyrinogen III methyltransferase/synthase
VGTVGDIAQRAKDANLEMPALTIVGPVVALHEPLRWFEKLPLFGKRVLVTRPEGQGDEMAQLLRDAGAEPLELPAVQIAAAEDPGPLDAAVRNLAPYAWLLFTSSNGVRFFFAALAQAGLDARALGSAKVAAVGPATRAALAEHGIRADVMPEEHRGEGLAEAILARGPRAGARVLLPRAAVAR